MDAYIKAVDYYLPEGVITNDDISKKFPEWTDEKIYSKVGIRCRHVSAENETALDMAQKAAEKLFHEDSSLKESVDFVLFCTQSPDYKLPTCILQNKLGLGTNCGALDFNLGCSGYVYGLSVAKGLITGGMAKTVLLLTGETYTKYIHPEDKGNISIFGDGASATIVSTEGLYKIRDFEFGTDGSGADELIVRSTGSRNAALLNDATIDEEGHIKSSDHLFMDGASIFSFTIKQVPKMIKNLLSKSGLCLEEIDYFAFHQANVYILEYLRKKQKIEADKFGYYIENVGNTVSSSIPILLTEKIKNGTLSNKKNVMLAGFGVGLSWAGCILEGK